MTDILLGTVLGVGWAALCFGLGYFAAWVFDRRSSR